MMATCSTMLKSGKVKTVCGKVLQRGLGTITLLVTDKSGGQSIKRFNESKYTVRVFQ